VRGHFSQEPSRGKRVFLFSYILTIIPNGSQGGQRREKKEEEEKDGAAFLVNRHLPRHIQEEGFSSSFGATTFTSSSSSLFPQK
jgi:hypothetical protein